MPLAKSIPPGSIAGVQHPIRELIRVFGLVQRIMELYFAGFGISGAQWGVLRNLHRAEQEGLAALRPKELSTRLLIRPPSVTGLISRLVRSGLVACEDSTKDLRVKRVHLTAKGRQRVEQVLLVHDVKLRQLVAGISDTDQRDLNRLLTAWRHHLEEIGAD